MPEARPKRLRLFFALWPDPATRNRIAADTAEVIRAASGQAVPAVNFHITLAFLGSIRESSIPEIVQVVRDVRFNPFLLRLEHVSYWPRSETAWLGPEVWPLQLPTLVDDIWNKLEDLGFVREDLRPYIPHLSLCRQVSAAPAIRLQEPIDWAVTSFGLAKSAAGDAAPVYTVLEHFHAGD